MANLIPYTQYLNVLDQSLYEYRRRVGNFFDLPETTTFQEISDALVAAGAQPIDFDQNDGYLRYRIDFAFFNYQTSEADGFLQPSRTLREVYDLYFALAERVS